jgi:hypothetical protein
MRQEIQPSAAIFAVALMLPTVCSASDEHGMYRRFIPKGFDSCSGFVAAIDDCNQGRCSKITSYKVWSAGYLTSYNLLTPDTYDIAGGREADTNDESTLIWLTGYCRKNPTKPYSEAIKSLTTELYPTRIKSKPDNEKRGAGK